MHQSFATVPKFLTFKCIYATSKRRGHSKSFALSKIYKIYFRSFTEAGHLLKRIHDLICIRADQVLLFSISS